MEVAPGIHHIQKARGANVYLLVDQDLTLVDTGYPGNGRVVVEYIESLGRRVEELKRVLITHSHPDHTGSVPELKELAPIQVLVHQADTRLDAQGRHLVSYLNVFGENPLPIPFLRRIVADGFLEDGQVLPILGGLRVIHTPGHTPGSICFYLESRKAIFLGDMVVNIGQYVGGSVPLPKTDLKLYEKSLRKIAELDFDIACLAHGQVFQGDADERIRKMLDSFFSAPIWLRVLRFFIRTLHLGRRAGSREL
ncbi:MAG: MBL fold metallo-hydrolase [Chloroflexi bacterium]|nr:MBL fold metallo-hydrolase [Chloroflexota bacterium]